MRYELERIWKEAATVSSKYYSDICLEVLKITTRYLNQDCLVPRPKFQPTDYLTRVWRVTATLTRSIKRGMTRPWSNLR
jgi:hypothetical protein